MVFKLQLDRFLEMSVFQSVNLRMHCVDTVLFSIVL